MPPEVLNCAFKPCKCTIEPAHAVRHDAKSYCSERCAEGRGCDHAHCNCGKYPEEEPDI